TTIQQPQGYSFPTMAAAAATPADTAAAAASTTATPIATPATFCSPLHHYRSRHNTTTFIFLFGFISTKMGCLFRGRQLGGGSSVTVHSRGGVLVTIHSNKGVVVRGGQQQQGRSLEEDSATHIGDNILSEGNIQDENPDLNIIEPSGDHSPEEGQPNIKRSSRHTKMPAKFNDFMIDSKLKYSIEKHVNF
nr:hypothetical protein [Tanacetum cinerariifolium]